MRHHGNLARIEVTPEEIEKFLDRTLREKVVSRLVQSWLPSSVLMLLGVILLAAVAGATRFVDLEAILPGLRDSPVVQLGLLLVLRSMLVRAVRCVALLLPTG